MGSLLGNYVHYKWKNYEAFGTYRDTSNWKNLRKGEEEKQKNKHTHLEFNRQIFQQHKQTILREASFLKQKDLLTLEKEFNNLVKKEYDTLKTLKNTDKRKYNSIMRLLIQELGDRFSSPTLINEILNGLEFVESTQSFKYTPSSRFTSKKTKIKSKIPSYTFEKQSHFRNVKGEIEYQDIIVRQIKPLMKYCEELYKYLDIHYDKSLINQDLQQLKQIRYNLSIQYDIIASQGKMKKIQNLPEINAVLNTTGLMANELAYAYKGQIDEVRFKYVDAESITEDINQIMAEFLGNIIKTNVTTLTGKTLTLAVKDALEVGKRQTSSVSSKTGTINLYKTVAKMEYEAGKAKDHTQIIKPNKKLKNIQGREFFSYDYNFSDLGDERQGKTDIEVVLSSQNYNISMKNTDLSKEYMQKINGSLAETSTVKLQDSSLLLYLLGVQNYHKQDLGNHYLNILAKREENLNANYYKMRQEGINSLSLYILYSALTGKGQLRQGREANIFAIYDKAKQKNGAAQIKLFDMYDILKRADAESQKFFNSQSNNFLYPSLASIYLNNDFADSGAAERISRLLIEAKQINIRATLSHQFLNGILRNR